MEYTENARALDDMEHELDADKPWSDYGRRLPLGISRFIYI